MERTKPIAERHPVLDHTVAQRLRQPILLHRQYAQFEHALSPTGIAR